MQSLRFRQFACVFALVFSGILSAATAADDRRVLLFLGDSITAGYGLDPDQAYPALLQQRIDEARLPWRVVNAGLSGDTTAGGLRRVDWLLRQRVDLFVVALGGNDGLRGVPADETRRNLAGILARVRARYPQARLAVAGMLMPPNLGPEYTEAFRAVFPAVARDAGATLVPFLLEGVGGVRELNQADGIHPTAQGQAAIAAHLWPQFEPLLRAP